MLVCFGLSALGCGIIHPWAFSHVILWFVMDFQPWLRAILQKHRTLSYAVLFRAFSPISTKSAESPKHTKLGQGPRRLPRQPHENTK